MNLNTTLSTALQSLMASSAEVGTANKNISNANTPGYTRESVVLSSMADNISGGGGGVVIQGYQSARDQLLQLQVLQQTQSQSGANAQLNTLQQVQTVFASSTNDIGSQMSTLFSSLSSLSTDPTNVTLRQAVMTAGGNLATSFNTASKTLTSLQGSLNGQVSQDVQQINTLSQQIAALNPQINQMNAKGQDAGTLQDQQDQLLVSLSKLTNVSITKSDNGVTISTANGTPLVVGPNSYSLKTTTGSDGMTHVLDKDGQDPFHSEPIGHTCFAGRCGLQRGPGEWDGRKRGARKEILQYSSDDSRSCRCNQPGPDQRNPDRSRF
jgi:flagellar hook-associated protein 1